jgi:hypothetical protein
MTDRAARRRASKREIRLWAWIAGGLAFVAPWAALAGAPKPVAAAASAGDDRRPAIVVRTITRRVIVTHPRSDAPVRFVAAPSNGSSSGAAAAPVPPPAPPATSTGGS